jgi:ankyrin repeat protein
MPVRFFYSLQTCTSLYLQCVIGYSPIHAAVSYNHIELVRYLLSNGADLNLKDEDGDTPILVCETIDMFDVLVNAGADPAAATNYLGESFHQKLLEDHNDELLSHYMNYMVRIGLGSDMNLVVTAHSENAEEDSVENDCMISDELDK